MKGSLRIARIAGIDIGIHWTFWLIIVFIGWVVLSNGGTPADVVKMTGFVFALFGCVVLHELGHALTALRFGVRTRDITLLPIGGVARLERIPEEPMQELVIAVMGPAVNVVIAAVLIVVIIATGTSWTPGENAANEYMKLPFLVNLAAVNIFLVLFNMLPAFPMDGGRVLRALLATQMGFAKATDVAAKVGAVMAVLFVAFAFFTGNLVLGLIAVFVFLGGQAENRAAQTRSALHGLPVRGAMVTGFRTLDAGATLHEAVDTLLAGSQQDFPVVEEGRLVGMLYRQALVRAIAQGGMEHTVREVMDAGVDALSPDAALESAIESLREKPAVPVLEDGRLVGLLTSENVGELIMINAAAAHAPA
ncbi:MAG: site-2 protease family protein [Phycisphaerales bacterium]